MSRCVSIWTPTLLRFLVFAFWLAADTYCSRSWRHYLPILSRYTIPFVLPLSLAERHNFHYNLGYALGEWCQAVTDSLTCIPRLRQSAILQENRVPLRMG